MDHKVTFGERVASRLQTFSETASEPVQSLVARLVAAPDNYRRKSAILAEFRVTLKACRAFPQEKKEALVTELEALLEIFAIESSDGLLNEWLHGISL